jgi:hypothetical protein
MSSKTVDVFQLELIQQWVLSFREMGTLPLMLKIPSCGDKEKKAP